MKQSWWQKLTIDWPCALGDWLWVMLVVEPARLIDGLTRRRVLHIIGLILLVIFFQQVVAMDLTFLFGVDLGLLMEVSAAVFILVARQQIKTTVLVIRRNLVSAKPTLHQAYRRGARRVRRAVRTLWPPKSSDEDGLVGSWRDKALPFAI
jgi:hypothetical protein